MKAIQISINSKMGKLWYSQITGRYRAMTVRLLLPLQVATTEEPHKYNDEQRRADTGVHVV